MKADRARRIVIAALLCLTGSSVRAQPTPVIRTETRVVLVDAIVTNKQGEYVRDLSAKDFRVWEDNKEQTIQSVSLEQGSANTRPRYLVLFFAGMSATDQLQSRQTISGFIDANAQENRKMAVVSYSGELRIDQNFTDDAGRLKEGVSRAISSGLSAGTADSASLNTLRALETLATNLRVLPGRKIIVLLSGGLQQSSFQKSELLAAMEACNKSDVAVYPVDVRPLSSQMGNKNDVRSASEGATPAPGIRVRGLDRLQGDAHDAEVNPQESATGNQQILFALANGTGGFVIPDFAELQRGLQRIGEEQAEYYTISYAPPDSPSGSKADNCHKLRVKVDRSGTAIRARTNYCSTKPQDLLAGTSTGQDLERRAVGAQGGSIAASIQLSYFYISPTVARAYLAMDIPPDALKFEKRKSKLHAELNFLGIATASDGNVGARFSDALKFDFDSEAQVESLRGKPLHYEKQFKIAPGRYNFAIAFGSGSESFGKLEMPLTVDARMPGELALSSLALSRETHPAAELGLAGSLVEDSTPLIAENVEFIPSGSNHFAKSDSGFFYCEVYADPASARVRVRVLDRKTGEPKSDSGFLKLDLPKSSPGDGDNHAIPAASSLPIEKLAAGAYQLEVTAEDSSGKQVKRTADFEIR
ncbi:MAG: VWA domain-containing protein [Bryobacteraceae bacterium]